MTTLARGFRSGDYRSLIRQAEQQGWDVYRTGSDHVAVVNPVSGARVIMTTTGSTASGHALDNARAALLRAGLDLRSKAERRLERRRAHKEQVMPKGTLLTDEQRQQIVELRTAGTPVKEIAETVGVSTKAVTTHTPPELQRTHQVVHPGRRKVSDAQVAKIAELRRAGKTIEEVAEAIGVSGPTVVHYQPDDVRKQSRYRSGPVEVVKGPQTRNSVIEDETAMESVADIVKRTTEQGGAYPVIRALVVKHRRYTKMMAEAEALGDDDLQLMLLEKTKLSPMEQEAMRLYDALQDPNGNGSAH